MSQIEWRKRPGYARKQQHSGFIPSVVHRIGNALRTLIGDVETEVGTVTGTAPKPAAELPPVPPAPELVITPPSNFLGMQLTPEEQDEVGELRSDDRKAEPTNLAEDLPPVDEAEAEPTNLAEDLPPVDEDEAEPTNLVEDLPPVDEDEDPDPNAH